MTSLGVCPSAGCEHSHTENAVALYPGPGEYCPECGTLLEALIPPAAIAADPGSWPKPSRWGMRVRKALSIVAVLAIVAVVGVTISALARVAVRVGAVHWPRLALAGSGAPQRTTKHAAHVVRGSGGTTRIASRAAIASAAPAASPSPSASPRAAVRPTPAAAARRTLLPQANAALPTPAADAKPTTSAAPAAAVAVANTAAENAAATPVQPATSEPSAIPSGPSCSRPDVPATMIRAAVPDMPALAQQLGASGTVQVVVSLNAQSRIVAARVQSSPSGALNFAALTAARNSQFRTQIRNCEAVAADYVLNVTFQ